MDTRILSVPPHAQSVVAGGEPHSRANTRPRVCRYPIVELTAQVLATAPPSTPGGNWWPWTSPSTSRGSRKEIREEGWAEGHAQDILLVLEQRGLEVSDDIRTQITGRDDSKILRRWLARAVTAPSVEEIFEEE